MGRRTVAVQTSNASGLCCFFMSDILGNDEAAAAVGLSAR